MFYLEKEFFLSHQIENSAFFTSFFKAYIVCHKKHTFYHKSSIPAPKCSTALVDKPKTLPGDCQINVGACRNIKCNAAQNGCSWNTFCQPIMMEREFVCAGTTYIQEVVTDCSCQLREKIEVRGRVVEQYGSDGVFYTCIFSYLFFTLIIFIIKNQYARVFEDIM